MLVVLFAISVASCSEDKDSDQLNVNANSDGDNSLLQVLKDSAPSEAKPSTGFYVINEDWYGHDLGSMNYFKKTDDGSKFAINYRYFRTINPGHKLGTTAQFGTFFSDKLIVTAKNGNVVTIADAKTLQVQKEFDAMNFNPAIGFPELVEARSFCGVNDTLGYISYNNGLRQIDLKRLQLKSYVPSISSETGAMCFAGGFLFALTNEKKCYLINVETNRVEKVLDGVGYYTLARSKDGNLWLASANGLVKVNPITLEKTEIPYPNAMKISDPFSFAWNAGSLCASTQENALYWTFRNSSTKEYHVIKYNIDTNSANTNFYILRKDDKNIQLAFYGAGLRVDPISDDLVLTVKREGWEQNGSYNWVYIVGQNGSLKHNIIVKGGNDASASYSVPAVDNNYYWFPALPIFEDVNQPEILINQVLVKKSKMTEINLFNKVFDADNAISSILLSVEIPKTDLFTYTFKNGLLSIMANETIGRVNCNVVAISNGKRVQKTIPIDIIE